MFQEALQIIMWFILLISIGFIGWAFTKVFDGMFEEMQQDTKAVKQKADTLSR